MEDSFGQKVWKEKPPGPEQCLLDEMFESGSITEVATPDSVRQSTPMFRAFSAKVFATHFRKTKARLGEFVGMVSLKFNLLKSFDSKQILSHRSEQKYPRNRWRRHST